jgi:hypothetical protein
MRLKVAFSGWDAKFGVALEVIVLVDVVLLHLNVVHTRLVVPRVVMTGEILGHLKVTVCIVSGHLLHESGAHLRKGTHPPVVQLPVAAPCA